MQRTIVKQRRQTPCEFPRSLALALFYVLLGVAALTGDSTSIAPAHFRLLRDGNVAELRQLLDQAVNINARDPSGNTLLMLTAVYGGTDSVRLLLERGADVNATNAAGATALMRAAYDPLKISAFCLNTAPR